MSRGRRQTLRAAPCPINSAVQRRRQVYGELPSVGTYLEHFAKLEPELERIRQPLHHP